MNNFTYNVPCEDEYGSSAQYDGNPNKIQKSHHGFKQHVNIGACSLIVISPSKSKQSHIIELFSKEV